MRWGESGADAAEGEDEFDLAGGATGFACDVDGRAAGVGEGVDAGVERVFGFDEDRWGRWHGAEGGDAFVCRGDEGFEIGGAAVELGDEVAGDVVEFVGVGVGLWCLRILEFGGVAAEGEGGDEDGGDECGGDGPLGGGHAGRGVWEWAGLEGLGLGDGLHGWLWRYRIMRA